MMQQGTSPLALEIIEKEVKDRTGKLILSDCGLTRFPPEIFEFEMTWLEELVITNGYEEEEEVQIIPSKIFKKSRRSFREPNFLYEIPEEIGMLKNLKKIRIGGIANVRWGIEYAEVLSPLQNLEEINLSGNNISDISWVQNFKKLQSADFSANQILDASPLAYAEKLASLNLSVNQIPDISFVENLSNLHFLDVSVNKIASIYFSKKINSLEHLILAFNDVSDISFVQNLQNLRILNLSGNQISDISPLHFLKKIENLYLDTNNISSIEVFSQLKNIELLRLGQNQITDLYPLLNLNKLSRLFLGKNQISQIQPLTQLQNLEELRLDDNPIQDCPPEVWQTNDIHQIRAYFDSQKREAKIESTKKEDKHLRPGSPSIDIENISQKIIKPSAVPQTKGIEGNLEATNFGIETPKIGVPVVTETETEAEIEDVKLIFVGNSGAGKTQLSKYFETAKLDKKRETTHGIRLNRWLPTGKVSAAFKGLKNKVAANVWDFGGQEYYHGTFRLFLSNYAVYILLWEEDTNKNQVLSTEVRDNENEDLQHYHYKYWLDNIRHYAPNSSVLMVQNKIDKDGRQRIDTKWLDDYDVFGDHYISLHQAAEKKNSNYQWSFDLFCNDLSACFQKVLQEEARQKKSIAWLKIRDAVVEVVRSGKKKSDNPFFQYLKIGKYIDLQDFEKACSTIESHLTKNEIYTLPRWLHNSGLVIYFGNDEALSDKVYLDPSWVTKGIYKILNETVRAKNGVFSQKDIRAQKGFSKETLLALMQEMEIVFEKSDEPGTYVAPQYLPETHPVEDLYAIAAKGLRQKAYFVRLPLYFFRKVLQRMIFFYGMSPNVDARYYWKQGILFEKKGTRVMFKGIMPETGGEHGVFLIGAEPVGAYRDIQKEVFHIIAEILEEKELDKINSAASNEPFSKEQMQTKGGSNLPSDIHHRPDNWTSRYETQAPPRWLKNMEVSVDGEHFVNYLKLCNENRKEAVFTESEEGERLRIHDFELLVDSKAQRPLKIFFSYSHKDTAIMNQLAVHLAPLKRMKKIETWSDKAIQAGDEWDDAIKENLRDSDIILLLVSADFIASTYIWEKEIPLAMELKKDSTSRVSRVIPIYLRPFDFSELSFASSEMIPKNEQEQLKAISQWENMD
ncbi:MAG TPA: TIR domain-containing protein, partial [Phaeodactylibacter sp.]|nr:TIR domain-containing protein [Phaeodactylibacter sp.]